jgi:hypothetical protein
MHPVLQGVYLNLRLPTRLETNRHWFLQLETTSCWEHYWSGVSPQLALASSNYDVSNLLVRQRTRSFKKVTIVSSEIQVEQIHPLEAFNSWGQRCHPTNDLPS